MNAVHVARRHASAVFVCIAISTFALVTVFAVYAGMESGSGVISGHEALFTDKADYAPGETVHVSGRRFVPGDYAMPVKRPDGSIVKGDGSFAPGWDIATADGSGYLAYDYILNGIEGLYEARAYPASWTGNWSERPIASVTFTDALGGDLDQCANGGVGDLPATVQCTSDPDGNGNANDAAWQNGNLNSNQAHYLEGDSVPYRIRFQDLGTDGTVTHTLTIAWDTTKSDKHAVDYPTTYNRTETDADVCDDLLGAGGTVTEACDTNVKDTIAIPLDPIVAAGADGITGTADDITQIPGEFTLFGHTSTSVDLISVDTYLASADNKCLGDGFSGNGTPGSPYQYVTNSTTCVTISFTSTDNDPVFAWGGHISTRADWGNNNSAVNISGSPYHGRLIDIDGKGGNQDRSLSAGAVIFPATITVIKDAIPEGDQAFDFALDSPVSLNQNFSLVDDGTISNTMTFTFTNPLDFAGHVLTETVPVGWDLTGIDCTSELEGVISDIATVDPNTGVSTFDLEEAENVTCTYTNVQRGTIVVEKLTDPSGIAGDFSFTGDVTGTISHGERITVTNLVSGTYTATEEDPLPNFALTDITCDDSGSDNPSSGNVGSRTATFELDPGETVVCTFTNEIQRGTIIVEKITVGGDGDFDFTGEITTTLSNGMTDTAEVLPGTYEVSELVPAGWDLTDISCDDGNSTGSSTPVGPGESGTAVYNVEAGETVTCTFTNTKRANITVEKVTIGDTGTFSFTSSSLSPSPFDLTTTGEGQAGKDSRDFTNLVPGTYDVDESDPGPEWVETGSSCSDGSEPGAIGLSPGEHVTCTFTNTKQANITVEKVTIGDTGTFSFTSSSLSPSPFDLTTTGEGQAGKASTDFNNLVPGTYDVDESDPGPEWVETGSSCSDGSDPGNIDLAAGELVTCTFTNTKRANIVVEKLTVPVTTTETFTFTGDVSGTISHGQRITVENVLPGIYTATEDDPTPGFDLIDITCDDGGSLTPSAGFVMTRTAIFNADPGETVVCTFTNQERGMVDLLKLTGGQQHPTMTWTFVLSGTNVNVSYSTPPASLDFDGAKLIPGETYTLCETGIPSGWALNWAIDSNGNGMIDEGETLPYIGAGTGELLKVYDPTFGEPDASNDNRCVDFQVQPGETVHFILDNVPPPGGDTRTPGYWKNWNTCSGGNQVETAAKNGGPDEGWYLLDDLLPQSVGTLTVTTCANGVLVLDHRDLESPNEKRASDAAYNVARNLLAAKLNLAAGAGSCQEIFDLVAAGDALLTMIDYDGTGTYLQSGDHLYQTANEIAGYLDDYNNGGCAAIAGVVPPEPPPAIVMYVESLDDSAVLGRRTWKVEIEVTVVDTDSLPVAGVKVSGDWSGDDYTGSSSCTTNSSGVCTIKRGRLPLGLEQVAFTISGLSAEGYNYDPDHPGNDSSILVDQP